MLDNVFLLYDGPKEIEAFQWAGDMWYLPKNDPQILERHIANYAVGKVGYWERAEDGQLFWRTYVRVMDRQQAADMIIAGRTGLPCPFGVLLVF